MPAKSGRPRAQINCHIEHSASGHSHELALSFGWDLEMEPAHYTCLKRECVIVLNKISVDAGGCKIGAYIGLREGASAIAMDTRNDELDGRNLQ